MSEKSADFFQIRQSLKENMVRQSSKLKKIKVCILYAIEEENIVVFDSIRTFAQDASAGLELFVGSKDPSHRFNDEWGKAIRGLKADERISVIHELKSTRSPTPSETSRILEYLEEIENPAMVYSGLNCLWSLSRNCNVASNQKLLDVLLLILKKDCLIHNSKIMDELMRVLSEIFDFNRINKPTQYNKTIEYLCTKHIKQICMNIRKKKDLELIKKACTILFVYTSCEIVISTLFELIKTLTDEDYRLVQHWIHWALLDGDSVLFMDQSAVINKKIIDLLHSKNKNIQKRAHDINIKFTEKRRRQMNL